MTPSFKQITATQTATGLPACYALDEQGRVWFSSGGAEGTWRLLDRFNEEDRQK